MKKILIGLIFFCCMGLFVTSCSEDENTSGGDISQMCISAILPDDISTDRVKTVDGHKLRGILELWTKGENANLVYREEVTVDPATGKTVLPFELTLEAGTYDYLMWVDYIDANTVAANSADGNAAFRYTDKYYDTSDLRNIAIKDMRNLINNDACDAFFYHGEVQKKGNEAFRQEIKLIRPFTKVSVLEKNLKEFNLLKGLSVSCDASMKFNVSTGKMATETVHVNYVESEFDPEAVADGTLFTAYFFADEESRKLGEINLSFTTDLGVQNVTVPQIIPLLRNQHIKVSGNMMAESPDPENEFEISFDIEVEDWGASNQDVVATEVRAKVGDFFYADGSYSSTYIKDEANPCIGIVFAVASDGGKASGDDPANYVDNTGAQKLRKIRGWVVAATEIQEKFKVKVDNPENPSQEVTLDLGTLPGSVLGQGKTDISGFKNTQVFKREEITLSDYPVAEQIINYENDPSTKAPENTSGWYWGAVNQYLILATEYANVTVENKVVIDYEYLTVGKSMEVLVKNQKADHFGLDGEQFYWSSTVDASTGKIFRVGLRTEGQNYGQTAGWKLNDARHFRPILTF
ncbi:DUF6562 domain-containing protein [Bacteroides thetaiotaomicron]|uniref:DUF6562 domain-containing protein n=1 Tax=Bacteroides thetaiotaomicron TaxID=818 RepID=UPI004063BF95